MTKKILSLFLLTGFFFLPLSAQHHTPQKQQITSTDEQKQPLTQKNPAFHDDVELPKEFSEELEQAQKVGDSRFFDEFMNMLFYLALALVLMISVIWVLKRIVNSQLDQTNRASDIKILEKRILTPKTTIYLLEIFGKTTALAESTNGASFLGEFFLKENGPEETHPSPSFENYLKKDLD